MQSGAAEFLWIHQQYGDRPTYVRKHITTLYASNYTPLRSKGERNNVSHSHMHTAVNVYRKSPLALAPEALL